MSELLGAALEQRSPRNSASNQIVNLGSVHYFGRFYRHSNCYIPKVSDDSGCYKDRIDKGLHWRKKRALHACAANGSSLTTLPDHDR